MSRLSRTTTRWLDAQDACFAAGDQSLPANKATDLYWPIVGGGGRLATRCPNVDKGNPTAGCSTNASAQLCDTGTRANCDVTVLNGFITAFNWAQKNFSAIWMRPFWSLVINSVISDVQSAGLNFVTSGDFSKSSVIDGFWALARKSVFIGSTQWQNPKSDLSDNPLASNAGPFNPFSTRMIKSRAWPAVLIRLAATPIPRFASLKPRASAFSSRLLPTFNECLASTTVPPIRIPTPI